MPDYRAYTVGQDGRFNGSQAFVSADDDAAIAKARMLFRDQPIEIWNGPRLVKSIHVKNAGITISDAESR